MTAGLIGHTGFVGSSLARTEKFDVFVNRKNLSSIRKMHFSRVVCAGLPAAKWLANQNPEGDKANLYRLQETLNTIRTENFTLISTIDVYPQTTCADESFDCTQQPNHAYGRHRLEFELFVRKAFDRVHIVRLPSLFGQGLKKNVLYDLLHKNQLDKVDRASYFQWYPIDILPIHLRIIEERNLMLVNLFTEPIRTGELLEEFFPHLIVGNGSSNPIRYDLFTRYGTFFEGNERYVLNKAKVKTALGKFIRCTV